MFVEEIKDSLIKVLKDLEISVSEDEIILEHPADLKNGDYSTNVALKINNNCRDGACPVSTPLNYANNIVSKWQEIGLPDCVDKVEVAGIGFINIFLKLSALGQFVETRHAASLPQDMLSDVNGKKTLVIDYSAPNIAKPFGIGHLRSTNIGQAIYNCYKFLGWKVIGDNHLGDRGTQFGKLIYIIRRDAACRVSTLTTNDLEKMYVQFHKEVETKPEMEKEAREWFKKLEEGDREAKAIWQACVDISTKEFDRVYKLLGVKIDYAYGESFYQDKMEAVLDDCRKKGILKESQGAKVVEIPGMELPAMLVKSDGATTYFLRDLAAVKFRIKEWQPDLIVYEVGADQVLHFTQLFNVCEQLGYGNKEMFVHIAHGLIRWPTGKFSTRKGDTIHLDEVLNEAIERAAAMGKDGVGAHHDAPVDVDIAEKVGIGAIKYNDLRQNPRTDVIFDWEKILTLSGNSGPYLQYTYARTCSVLAKASNETNTNTVETRHAASLQINEHVSVMFGISNTVETRHAASLQTEEILLLRTLYRFPEIVSDSAKEFSPNLLCNFLFDVAQKFNSFYDKHRILRSKIKYQKSNPNVKTQSEDEVTEEQSEFRVLLTAAVGQVLQNGLNLLGIEALSKM